MLLVFYLHCIFPNKNKKIIKIIANVSISNVQNMKYICISVENRHYDTNTDKNDELSNLRTPLAHAVEPQLIFFLDRTG